MQQQIISFIGERII
ncbi:unnamed protein product, partial [Rotaria sordida]